ncbi:AraC family transcriptional regulator [Paenibacillus sp.]|uniref:AraC family transcriptional regulator n=1 Tax=Paenibacillus sp. TaxID=58172 RepID=UPI002811D4E9|nr:AraC family transcriptional regulator [Paenibacillus sp.]
MSLRTMRTNGKLYVRLLLGVTLCVALALIASSFVFYFSYSGILQRQVFQSDLSRLSETSRQVERLTESAQSLSFQIYRNSNVAKLLYYNNPSAFDIQGAMIDLSNYLATTPFIESIYVYNPANKIYYVASNRGQSGPLPESDLPDKDILKVLDRYEDYKAFTPIPRSYKLDPGDAEPTGIYTYLCYDAIGFDRAINSAVVVNVSADWINREIANGTAGSTYIVDDHDRILSVDALRTQALGGSEELLRASMRSDRPGYVVSNFEGAKSLISYTAPDGLSWKYIRVTPYQAVTVPIREFQKITLAIAASVLLTGLLLSWLLSRYLYVPIHHIVNRVKDLETERRDNGYAIRQAALRKLIYLQHLDARAQLAKLKQLGIAFDFTRPYRLLYVRIDRFASLKEKSGGDLLIYKFAVMNIGSEIISKYYRVEAVDMDDDGILFLLNTLEPNEARDAEWLDPMLSQIQASCMEYIRIGLTAAVSPVAGEADQLPALYRRTRDATLLRFFHGLGSRIDCAKLESGASREYAFPAVKEKRMIDALMAGKPDEAKVWFQDILQETSAYPIQTAVASVARLRMTLANLLSEMLKNGSLPQEWNVDPQLPAFHDVETLEELTASYFRLFDELTSRIAAKRNNKQETLVRKINELIRTRYADPSLSLNWLADELSLSSFHVSRVYRQHTLTPIVDAINQVRMEKAKELLLTTDVSIADIAERTGYTNSSYFHRMFKKSFGVTPAEFRKSKQGISL